MYTGPIYKRDYDNYHPEPKQKMFLILIRKKFETDWEVYIPKDSYHGSISEQQKDLIIEALLKLADLYDLKTIQI